MQRPRGTRDVFGKEQKIQQFVSQVLYKISEIYNYQRIDTPIFEKKDVFLRKIGETSDIVKKEMYEFLDRSNRNMVLRPEATAPTIRAIVENKLYAQNLPLKLYYKGPMFRYENPQKGRQRQFSMFGVEVIADRCSYLDLEVILMANEILRAFKINYKLEINSLGSKEVRDKWSKALKQYFEKYKTKLEPISISRLSTNPMRILDDKKELLKPFVQAAPNISDFYSQEDKSYLNNICDFLKKAKINFVVNNQLVRGLDYYTNIVFEFKSISKSNGSKNTIIGGGRYQNLLHDFGGPKIGGIGFGLGIERLINEIRDDLKDEDLYIDPDVYVINLHHEVTNISFSIVSKLRQNGFKTIWNHKPIKINKGLEKADKSFASIKIIIGVKDVQKGIVTVKHKKEQLQVEIKNIFEFIHKKLRNENNNEKK